MSGFCGDQASEMAAAAGAWCARDWYRASGPAATASLSAVYVATMGGSHPLARHGSSTTSPEGRRTSPAGSTGQVRLRDPVPQG